MNAPLVGGYGVLWRKKEIKESQDGGEVKTKLYQTDS
jgi:hypothetical protein